MSLNFKEQFFSYAKLMGSHSNTLIQHLGQFDDIEKNYHRSFVWYKESKASFRINNIGIVEDMTCPIRDAYGRQYLENANYFTIDGIKLGMSKFEVFEIFGEADIKAELVWYYKNKGGLTQTGQKFSLCIGFRESNNKVPLVSHFEARIK